MDWYSDSLLGTTAQAREEALSKIPPELVVMLSNQKAETAKASAQCRLPAELMDIVLDDFKAKKEELPMSVEEAIQHRAKLMYERAQYHERVDGNWLGRTYECVEE